MFCLFLFFFKELLLQKMNEKQQRKADAKNKKADSLLKTEGKQKLDKLQKLQLKKQKIQRIREGNLSFVNFY